MECQKSFQPSRDSLSGFTESLFEHTNVYAWNIWNLPNTTGPQCCISSAVHLYYL